MRAAVMTREYPPEVYGGAGVHVEYLVRELERLIDVEVRCFGAPRDGANAYQAWPALADANAALQTISVDLLMAASAGADLVHSHTWYANLAGHLAKLLHDVPHVATTHSLEPERPWKREQLGDGGYALSCFCERTGLEGADAVVAVSGAMRDDVLRVYPAIDAERVHVIHNGIDPDEYRPDHGTSALERYGVDPARPSVVFVGRITHQKGVTHLLDAGGSIDAQAQLVLAAGAPDTEELARETESKVARLRDERGGIVWIEKMLERSEVVQLLTHATVFVCPSVYEPLGIVNLEAMACETAVVASAVGGIPEVVEDGVTGLLAPPADPEALATAVNELVADPERARQMGVAGRRRAVEQFSWRAVAERTAELYEQLVARV